MNPTTNGKALSEYLEAMVEGGALERDIAADFNELPNVDLQHEALNIYRDNKQITKLITKHLLDQASGKVISEAVPQPTAPPPEIQPVQQPTTLAEHLNLPKGGKAAQIMHKLERFGAWDLIFTLEGWMAVNVPPYRWVRQGFSLAVSIFSVEKVFAALLTLTLLYGGYRLVGWTWHHFEKGASSQTMRSEISTGALLPQSGHIPVPQLMEPRYVSGHKLELRWNSVGEGYVYRIVYGDQQPTRQLLNGQTVNTPGAVINIAGSGEPQAYVAVIAVSPQGEESEPSLPVRFDLKPWNNDYSIEPLAMVPAPEVNPPQAVLNKPVHKVIKQSTAPTNKYISTIQYVPHTSSPQPAPQTSFLSSFTKKLVGNADGIVSQVVPIAPLAQGINATKNAALQANAETKPLGVPAPKNLRWDRAGAHGVQLLWDPPDCRTDRQACGGSPGPGYRYNVYVAYAGNHPVFDTGNDAPLDGPEITWTAPSEGTQVFEIYLKAVDAQGHESAESNHIIADLRIPS